MWPCVGQYILSAIKGVISALFFFFFFLNLHKDDSSFQEAKQMDTGDTI